MKINNSNNKEIYRFGIPYNIDSKLKLKKYSDIAKKKSTDRKKSEYKTFSEKFLADLNKLQIKEKRKKKKERLAQARKFLRQMKKESYKYKDMQHPAYKQYNRYRFKYFGNSFLPRSIEGLTANQAWGLLAKCWNGFKMSIYTGNLENARFYAEGIQKYLYYLEEVPARFEFLGVKPYKETMII